MAFDNRHDQPGRRFAKGATWDDIALGTFGFVSHVLLFLFLGGVAVHSWPEAATPFLWTTGLLAALCLVVRGRQVGSTTTKESVAAIREAVNDDGDAIMFLVVCGLCLLGVGSFWAYLIMTNH